MKVKNYNKHSFNEETGVFECYTYAIKKKNQEESEKQKNYFRELGIENESEDAEVYGEPIKTILNFNMFGGVLYFNEDKVELFEKDNFVETTSVVFVNEYKFIFLMSFAEFKKIHETYIESLFKDEEQKDDDDDDNDIIIDLKEEIETYKKERSFFQKIKDWFIRKIR